MCSVLSNDYNQIKMLSKQIDKLRVPDLWLISQCTYL